MVQGLLQHLFASGIIPYTERRWRKLTDCPTEVIMMIAEAAIARHEDLLGTQHLNRFGRQPRLVEVETYSKDGGLKDVANLAATCRHLEAACSPSLFENVTLETSKAVLRFAQILTRKVYLRGYVKILTVPAPTATVVQEDEHAASELVATDTTAAHHLKRNAIPLPVLVLIRVLQLLPRLRGLSIPGIALQLHLWPKKDRLVGSELIEVHLTANQFWGTGVRCDGPGGWLRSFQEAKRPSGLMVLYFHHDCTLHHLNHHIKDINAGLTYFASSLRSLNLQVVPVKCLSLYLEPCTALQTLIINGAYMTLKDIVAAFGQKKRLRGVMDTLEILEIHMRPSNFNREAMVADANAMMGAFEDYAALKHLLLPMPWPMAETHPVFNLPLKLEELSVAWIPGITGPYAYTVHQFVPFLLRGVEMRMMPKTLKTIVLVWDRQIAPTLNRTTLPFFVTNIPIWQQACVQRGVQLHHRRLNDRTQHSSADLVTALGNVTFRDA